jgi:transcriptional regulator with XRE-family HTH domain
MSNAKVIRDRRLELGLSDVEVAEKLGLTPSGLGDLELYDDELETAVSLGTVRCLCSLLGLSLRQVLKMPVGDATRPSEHQLPGEVMRLRREQSGVSQLDLAERVGSEEAVELELYYRSTVGRTRPFTRQESAEATSTAGGILTSEAAPMSFSGRPSTQSEGSSFAHPVGFTRTYYPG